VRDARRVIPGTLRLAGESFVDEDKLKRMEGRGTENALNPWEGERTLRTGRRSLVAADLRFVNLSRADLRGVTFDYASIAGAQLPGARLDGPGTSLAKASLDGANLKGASLFQAQLQGASLDGAQFQGASLFQAQLQGALLDGAQLQGAALFLAQLQGASLDGAQLQGASLDRTFVFRTSVTEGTVIQPVIAAVNADPVFLLLDMHADALTDSTIERWIAAAKKYVVNPGQLGRIDRQFTRLKDKSIGKDEDARSAAVWMRPPNPDAYGLAIARLVCAASLNEFDENLPPYRLAPHAARGLMHNGVLQATKDALPGIAARMRSGRERIVNCPGVEGFTDADWAELDKLPQPIGANPN